MNTVKTPLFLHFPGSRFQASVAVSLWWEIYSEMFHKAQPKDNR